MPPRRSAHRSLLFSLLPWVILPACSGAPSPLEKLRPEVAASIHYVVTPREGGARLSVEATFPAGLPAAFHVDESMIGWVQSPEVATPAGWSKLPFDGDTWKLSGCEGGCRVRYQFDLAGAARESGDVNYAAAFGRAFLAPPSTWLLHPAAPLSGIPYRFRVTAPGDVRFVTGVLPVDSPAPVGASPSPGANPASEPAKDAGIEYGADISDLPDSPYSVFGDFQVERVPVPKGTVEVAIVNNPPPAGNGPLVKWIAESAAAVSAYYGRFPLPHAAIIVLVEEGASMGYATTVGNGGGAITLRVGRDIPDAKLLHSWQMTHEMLHLAFPNLLRRHRWLEEGMATYVEPLARARLGALSEQEVWRGVVKGMFFAQPLPGEGGLDETPTWGRTYWGGALFCLLADVRIREQTGNARSLDDALRAILDHGGNVAVRWEIERVLSVGDAATGTSVLTDLHREMGRTAVTVDLAELWARLGIRSNSAGELEFDDGAPLANIRRSMTAPPAPAKVPAARPN